MIKLEKLGLNPSLETEVVQIIQEQKSRITSLALRVFDDSSCLEAESDKIRLAVIIACLERTKSFYDRLNISEDIFYDTMSDIAVWCSNNHNKGLHNYRWLTTHVKGELFKLGRLQYQLYCCRNKSLDYSLLPFDFGEHVIYLHIPQGGRLLYEDCLQSIRQAEEFFRRFFPDYSFQYFFCESWLLFDGNKHFMNPSSNILKFSSLFQPAYSSPDDSQAIERIFGSRQMDIHDYPENTSLQKAAKKFLLDGNKLGVGIGTIKIKTR